MDIIKFPDWIPKELYDELRASPVISEYQQCQMMMSHLDSKTYMPQAWDGVKEKCGGDLNKFLIDLFKSLIGARVLHVIAKESDSPVANKTKMNKIISKSKELLDLLDGSLQSDNVAELWRMTLVHSAMKAKGETGISLFEYLPTQERSKWYATMHSKLTHEFILNALTDSAQALIIQSDEYINDKAIKPLSPAWRSSLTLILKDVFDRHFSTLPKKEFCSFLAALLGDDAYSPSDYLDYWRDNVKKPISRSEK